MSQRNSKTIFLGLVLASSTIPAFAQLNIPNPLIEPISRQQRLAAPGQPEAIPGQSESMPRHPNMPPLPSDMPGSRAGMPQLASSASDESSKAEAAINNARAQFSGFVVAAILGDKAVLRRVAGTGATGGQAGVSQMLGNQIPLASQSSAAPGAGATGSRSESLTVRHNALFDHVAISTPLIAKIADERVTIYVDSPSKFGRHVIFIGEVDGAIATPRTITLQTKDDDYKNLINVKAGANKSSSSNSSDAQRPGSPSQGSQ